MTTPDLLGTFYLIYKNRPGAWGTGAEFAKREAVAQRVKADVVGADGEVKTLLLTTAQVSIARRLNAVFVILAGMAVCSMGIWLGGFATGLVASQLVMWHPAITEAHAMAMSDATAVAFGTAAMLWLMMWLQAPNAGHARGWRHAAVFAIAEGLSLALACGAKMNAIVPALVTGVAALWLLYRLWRAPAHDRNWSAFAGLAGALLVGAVLFVAINPTLHANLRDGLVALVREHRLTTEIQADFIGRGFESLPEQLAATGRLLCGTPLLGAVCAALAGWQAVRLFRDDAGRACAVWLGVAVVLVVAWLPFLRGRYVLPILPPGALLLARACTEIVQWLRALRRSNPAAK